MTVKQLIEQLQKMPQDLPVWFAHEGYAEIDFIEFEGPDSEYYDDDFKGAVIVGNEECS